MPGGNAILNPDPHIAAAHLLRARDITRRHFFGQLRNGVGLIALASLMGALDNARAGEPEGAPNSRAPHFPPRAKRVVYLHMAGSPPQQDLYDYKPRLNELDGKPCPADWLEKERFAFIKGHPKILGSPYKFAPTGQAGLRTSEL